MKALALAAMAAAFAAPAFAADVSLPPSGDPIYAPVPLAVVGHLQLGVGPAKWDSSDGFGIFEGAGRANIPLHRDWNLQVDLNGHAEFYSGGYTSTSTGAAAHLWHRGAMGAAGVFGGAMFGNGTIGFIGAEGTLDVSPQATFGAQASYAAGTFDFNFWNARGWASYYFTPNTKLRGDVGYTSDSDDVKTLDLSAELEHRFTGTAFSVFGLVGYQSVSYSGPGTNSMWRGLIGARIFLDQPGTTLHDHDHQVPWDVRVLRMRSVG